MIYQDKKNIRFHQRPVDSFTSNCGNVIISKVDFMYGNVNMPLTNQCYDLVKALNSALIISAN